MDFVLLARAIFKLLTLKWFWLITSVVISSGWFMWTNHTIHALRSEVAQKTEYIAAMEKKIAETVIQYKKIQQGCTDLLKMKQDADRKYKKLETTLDRDKAQRKSLEELAAKKPNIIQKLINEATEKQRKCIESLSRGDKCEQ